MTLNEMEIAELEEAVEAGVEFMDAVWPEWRERIKVDELAMLDGNQCIIGQAGAVLGFGYYHPKKFGITAGEAYTLGFSFDTARWGSQQQSQAWDLIDGLWRESIIDGWPTIR